MTRNKPKISLKLSQEEIDEVSNELNLKGSLKELFSSALFRRNLIIMVIIWSFCAFAFFLVPFYMSVLETSNMFLISLALALAEIIASVICLSLI